YMRTRTLYVPYLCADQPERAQDEEQRGIGAWSQKGFHVQHYWDMFVRCEIDLYRGMAAEAWKRLSRSWPEFKRSMLGRCQALFIESRQVRARVALALAARESTETLLKKAEDDAQAIERETMPYADPQARLIRAGVAATRGEAATAASLLLEAETAFRKS